MTRRSRLTLRSIVLLPFLPLLASPAGAQAFDPAALRREIDVSRLDASSAVSLKQMRLNVGLATLRLDDGVLVPATPVGGRVVEMVFLGSGRISLEPPDEIEAGQLELFTGAPRLDEEFREAVLVVALDGASGALFSRPKVAALEPALAERAAEVYARWKESPERKLLHVDGGILIDAAGDPVYQGYFAARFSGSELGDFLYLVEPDAREQVTLGRFVTLEATAKERRKILRQLEREQRRGRLIGLEVDDLGQWDTWLSASLRDRQGAPMPGAASFEPERYTIEVALAERDLALTGRARLDLQPVVAGARAVALRLNNDLEVRRVTDGRGEPLFFQRSGRDLTVLLGEPAAAPVAVIVEYSGKLVEKDGRTYALLDTQDWYPHAGSVDRAAYDVTFHWPKRLDLLACGRRADGGETADGLRWERRTLDLPAAGFAFEVGRYKTEILHAGHVEVTLAFDPDGVGLGKEVRQEIAESVTGSLAYFEELFGPYPLDHLTVVTVPRDFSQAMLGFVTLSNLMMIDLDIFNLLLGLEDRRTVIAHEIAHQWWGHMVGWTSYRDQWISEAMANYAAMLYAKERLGKKDGPIIGPTTGWQSALTATTADGRPIESLGPVVLGERLFSSRCGDAYQAIVYKKGAVVLDMLARSVGERGFRTILKELPRVVAHRAISTEDFVAAIERTTGSEFDWFSDRYLYGTGLADVYYTYRFEPAGPGKWAIKGEAHQQTPYRFRYRVVKTGQDRLDVARERLDQIAVEESALVVPVQVAVYNPAFPASAKGRKDDVANGMIRGHALIRGARTPFEFSVELEPKDLWLDRDAEIFGRFFNESRSPKRVLFYQALDAAAAGDAATAEALYARALAAEVQGEVGVTGPRDKGDLARERRELDGQIELGLARLRLEQGRDTEAQASFERARKAFGRPGGWVEEELQILESRLEMRRGEFDRAFKRLSKGLLRGSRLGDTESYVLLAIAAQATGHADELRRALEEAKQNGADVALLTAPR